MEDARTNHGAKETRCPPQGQVSSELEQRAFQVRGGCGPRLPTGKTSMLGMGRQGAKLGYRPQVSSQNAPGSLENLFNNLSAFIILLLSALPPVN